MYSSPRGSFATRDSARESICDAILHFATSYLASDRSSRKTGMSCSVDVSMAFSIFQLSDLAKGSDSHEETCLKFLHI